MSQHYSEPAREDDPHALPDIEVFYMDASDCDERNEGQHDPEGFATGDYSPGFYWWSCFPGCLPDGDPCGPFATHAEALADAQSNSEA